MRQRRRKGESRSQGKCQNQTARDPRRGAGSPRGAGSGEWRQIWGGEWRGSREAWCHLSWYLLLRPISLALNSATRPTRSLLGGISAILSADCSIYNQMLRDTTLQCTWRNTDDRGQKRILLIKSKDSRRYRLRSPPMKSEAHPTSFRQNLVKIL